MKSSLFALTCLAIATIGASAQGQSSVTYEDGPDGVRYRVTHQVVQRSIPTTEIQTREQKVYQPQVTTEYQSYQQTYLTPVTQYQWEPHLRNPLGLLGTPYWTHELRPVTRWEARPATVQVPVAKTNWVETTQHDSGSGDDLSPGASRSGLRRAGRPLRFELGPREFDRNERREPDADWWSAISKAIRRVRKAPGPRAPAAAHIDNRALPTRTFAN